MVDSQGWNYCEELELIIVFSEFFRSNTYVHKDTKLDKDFYEK